MKVFISWSGARSKAVAEALRTWLPSVLQAVQPYMSAEDLDKGSRWSGEIARELEVCSFGIICLTPENMSAPWISFEAGALSKSMDNSRVTPLLLDLSPAEITGPLTQFQATELNKKDVARMVKTINDASDRLIENDRVEAAVDMCGRSSKLRCVAQVKAALPS